MSRNRERLPKRTKAEIRDSARRTFSSSARQYVTSSSHRMGADLERLVAVATEHLGGLEGCEALDVATGGGHVALALAQRGAHITATDLIPEMLAEAKAFLGTMDAGSGVTFREADSGSLPFEDASFDLVTCRIAAHHFAEPLAFLSEAVRTLRPGGLLVLIDNIAPEDTALGLAINQLEQRRDDSHVEAYSVSWWITGLVEVGLEPVRIERFWRTKQFRDWARRTAPPGQRGTAHEIEVEQFVRALPARVRNYLGVQHDEQGRLAYLRHEVALLAAERRSWDLSATFHGPLAKR